MSSYLGIPYNTQDNNAGPINQLSKCGCCEGFVDLKMGGKTALISVSIIIMLLIVLWLIFKPNVLAMAGSDKMKRK